MCPELLHSQKRTAFIEKMVKELQSKKVFAVYTEDPVKLLKELKENYGLAEANYVNLELDTGKIVNEYVFQLP